MQVLYYATSEDLESKSPSVVFFLSESDRNCKMSAVAAFELLRASSGKRRSRVPEYPVSCSAHVMRNGSVPSLRSSFRLSSRCFHLRSLAAMYLASTLRRERRWWTIHMSMEESRGFWETKVPLWHKNIWCRSTGFLAGPKILQDVDQFDSHPEERKLKQKLN